MTIRLAEPADQPAWDAYVLSREEGLAYQLFAWKEAVESAYGFDCPCFLAEEQGRIQGILPLAHVAWPLRPGALISLPYCDEAGPLADDSWTADALVHAALEYARNRRIPELELRLPSAAESQKQRSEVTRRRPIGLPSSLRSYDVTSCRGREVGERERSEVRDQKNQEPSTKHQEPETRNQEPETRNQEPSTTNHEPKQKVRMLLPLPESSRILMESLKSKVRSQVKKPTRDGLSASLGGSELLPDFYPIFCGNMRDLGSPVHSRSWFESVFCSFGPRARCGLVRMPDGMPAACGIILLHANTVSIPWASSLKRCNRFNPNMLLYWTFLEHAADSGYACFDFGRSTPGEGTHRFKAQWGAQEQPLHWVRIQTRTGEVIPLESSSQGRLRSLVEACFRRLPLPAATFLGSRLRRYIPL